MPAIVLSKRASKPPDRCELMDEWLRWCGRWELVGPAATAAAAETSVREVVKEEVEGDLLRKVPMFFSRRGSELDGASGDDDERDDFDAAAI